MGMVLIILSVLGGKEELFLLLNNDLGRLGDVFFHYATFLGDGIMCVPFAMWIIFYKRKWTPLVISAIIFSTLLVNIGKHYVFENEARPTSAISNQALIHTVEGVELHKTNSFPSGHSSTAFSIYLIACLVLSARYLWLGGFFLALIAGYSRIYLAQHFPLDAGAGMIVAVISVYLSLLVQKKWTFRKA
jgi:membrane-associated phospholipid phosphatase